MNVHRSARKHGVLAEDAVDHKLVYWFEEAGLEEAEEEGVYLAAEHQVKVIVTNFLGGFEGYEVVFL